MASNNKRKQQRAAKPRRRSRSDEAKPGPTPDAEPEGDDEGAPYARSVLDYGHNLLTGTALRRADALRWRQLEHVDLVERLLEAPRPRRRRGFDEDDGPDRQRARFERYLRRAGARPRPPRPPLAPVAANLVVFAELFALDADERAVLTFLLAQQAHEEFVELTDAFGGGNLVSHARTIAAATQRPPERVLAALRPAARLPATGLVAVHDENHPLRYKIQLKPGLSDLAQLPALDREQVRARFLCATEPSTLGWADFRAVDESAKLARTLLGAALRRRQRGVNVLFYGPTGTGKTELARRLADGLGVPLFAAGRADEYGEAVHGRARLSSLLMGQQLLGGGADALLLFDELEDVFDFDFAAMSSRLHRSARAGISKQWFNLLLEENVVPTIWISNVVEGIDPAFLRRFTFSIALRAPGAGQRARILAHHLGDDPAISAEARDAIAQRFAVSAAQLGDAVATARLLVRAPTCQASTAEVSRGDASTTASSSPRAQLEQLLTATQELLGADRYTAPSFDPHAFRVEALNASEDLAQLADQLAGWKASAGAGLSLCFYGAPGTGKSEYARYLAYRMDRPVVARRVSDLLSMWVGRTEQEIAEAFREARDEHALLLFDEVDAFLRDREQAHHGWEVTQVNEFLQQLETHRGVVVCTTNLWHGFLDAASLRRFVFKIAFDALDGPRARRLFGAMLAPLCAHPLTVDDQTHVARQLGRLAGLTPGDLAVVRRKLLALDLRPELAELLALVEAEVRAKREAPARRALAFR